MIMKLFLIDTFVGEHFLAEKNSCVRPALVLPLIHSIDLNIKSCLLYYSCIIPAVEERYALCERQYPTSDQGGTAGPLLPPELCFPPDLWSLRGVGRSLCDYCLHADLYLTFNYLRGSAACWCQYIPSFGTSRGRGDPLWYPPHPFSLCLLYWA